MKIGILTNVLNEHSGARASVKLGEALSLTGEAEVAFLATEEILSQETLGRLREKHKVFMFKKPRLVSFELIGIIRKERFDIISAHCSLRILISAYLASAKIFRTDYGTQFPSINGNYGNWRVSLAQRTFFLMADAYVFIRDYLKFFFCHWNLAISADQVVKIKALYKKNVDYIYLGGDDFNIVDLSPRRPDTSKLKILSVSRFVPYKGFHFLIEAFKSFSKSDVNLELILVGSQPNKKYLTFLKNLVGDDKRIKFIFDPSDRDLSRLFSSSHIYASGTRWEAFGLPFLEASGFGLPVLGFSYFGPGQEIIKDGVTGFLAKDETEFKMSLKQLIEDSNLRWEMGLRGQTLAKNFTWDQTAIEYLKIFKRL